MAPELRRGSVDRVGNRWKKYGPRSVRVRTTAGAVLVVGVALLAGSIGLVTLLDRTLTGDVRVAAIARAEEVAALLETSGDPGSLAVADVEEQLIQVLDRDGAVVASSSNVAGRDPVATLAPGESVELDGLLEDAPFLVVATVARTPDGDFTILMARSLSDASEAVLAVRGLLALGVPILLLVVGVTTWHVVGRALRPVAAIRGEVEQISDTQLHRRVPQPPGSDEIADLARTMNGMLARLDDAAARQRRFVGDASHELRSPVASIRQHAEVALRHPERTTVPALAETVLAEDLRVQRLVEDLLVLARTDEGTPPSRAEIIDLDDLVNEHARRLRATSGLHIDSAGLSAGRVRGVPSQLNMMIGNLIDNAARHANSRISVGLITDQRKQLVVFRVDDDGAGIPAEDRHRVFERFVRLDDARARDHGGAGLGLAIVEGVVRVHGGTIAVTEAAGGGASFQVCLPLQD